jgi:hypothetical protein
MPNPETLVAVLLAAFLATGSVCLLAMAAYFVGCLI